MERARELGELVLDASLLLLQRLEEPDPRDLQTMQVAPQPLTPM